VLALPESGVAEDILAIIAAVALGVLYVELHAGLMRAGRRVWRGGRTGV